MVSEQPPEEEGIEQYVKYDDAEDFMPLSYEDLCQLPSDLPEEVES